MLPTLLILAAALTLTLVLCGAHRRATAGRGKRDGAQAPRQSRGYWGVTPMPPASGVCCESMREIQGRSFPKDQAPPLPLPGCSLLHCQCYYQPLPERRSGQDLRSGKERRQDIRFEADKPDRRSSHDRRRTHATWEDSR